MTKVYLSIFFFTLLSSASFASSGESKLIWQKKTLEVCWLDQASFNLTQYREAQQKKLTKILANKEVLDTQRKLLIQKKIESEFTIPRTGIAFTGWKSCQKAPQADLKIIIGNDPEFGGQGTSIIGRIEEVKGEQYLPLNAPSFVYLNLAPSYTIIGDDNDLLMTAVHEFGHVAGLRHENIRRDDAQNDPSCAKYNVGFEDPYSETKYFSVYDPNSIMSYCFGEMVGYKTGLEFNGKTVINMYDQPISIKSLLKVWKDDSIVKANQLSDDEYSVSIEIGLSRGDVHGLKCLHVYQGQQKEELCRPDYKP